jgi:hypothetical protein
MGEHLKWRSLFFAQRKSIECRLLPRRKIMTLTNRSKNDKIKMEGGMMCNFSVGSGLAGVE